MANTPRTEPAAAAPFGPSAEPLPDFGAVDVGALPEMTPHPVLREVADLLLRNWLPEGEAVAYYDDGPSHVGLRHSPRND
ncbi:YxD-tail cyclophane-containing RiPP peptide [Streptomyces sp. NPDC021749]|uniref:YxD-tail cyclophane-containing RiPP peptide n=1 Tax=Streptomyces sp. NPDC021749 TaxID=3154905 RepID=UPI0033C1D3BD